MPISRRSVDPLQKAIPKNPKYDNIQPTIDTGASISKYMKKLEEFRENFKMKDDEIFKRMKLATFVQLILQIAEIRESVKSNENIMNNSEINVHTSGDNENNNLNSSMDKILDPPSTARSTLESLVTGVGEFDTYTEQTKMNNVQKMTTNWNGENKFDCPYLLLDLRDREEYDRCHIITARSYPIAMLSRSVNFETNEMLSFRNKPGHIILLYDEDERIAPRAATTLVQRGYCNLFMLSGGLKLAWKLFPEGLIIGQMPISISRLLLKSRNKDRLFSRSALRQNSASSLASRDSLISSGSTNYSTNSRNMTPQIYCHVGSRDNVESGYEEFLREDLINLTLTLEKNVDEDNRSVRSGYARSTVSSVCHSTINGDKKPFR